MIVSLFVIKTRLFLFVTLISLFMVSSGIAQSSMYNSSEAVNLPTIDGVRDDGEWTNMIANETLIESRNEGFEIEHQFTLYAQNDASNLYLAISFDNEDFNNEDSYDSIVIRFDGDNNNIADSYEDVRSFNGLQFEDRHSSDEWSHSSERSDNGEGAATYSDDSQGIYFYEMAIPLNSGDSRDLQTSAGSTIGLYFEKRLYEVISTGNGGSSSSSDTVVSWPVDASQGDYSTFAKLNLVDSSIERPLYDNSDNSDPTDTDASLVSLNFYPLLIIPVLQIVRRRS